MSRQKGFSLIELLVVIAIILIIAAIAIPNLLRSRMAANEASAVSSVRSINTAQIAYNATYSTIGYASALSLLGPGSVDCTSPGAATSTNSCLLDNVLAAGTKSGYTFKVTSVGTNPTTDYAVVANPVVPGSSGQRHFYSDATGVVRYNNSATATSADIPIQ